jgi:hypothetical protein
MQNFGTFKMGVAKPILFEDFTFLFLFFSLIVGVDCYFVVKNAGF